MKRVFNAQATVFFQRVLFMFDIFYGVYSCLFC